jgi:integrase
MATWKPATKRDGTKVPGRFYVRASIGGRQGKRISTTITATTRTIGRLAEEWEAGERARHAAAEQLAQAEDDEPEAPATLSSVWADLIAESTPSWSPGHLGHHERIRRDCDLAGLGAIPIAELSRADVSAYLNAYASQPVRGADTPSARSIKGRLKLIRSAVNYALDTGLIGADPTRKLRPPAGRFIEERDVPTPAELAATLRRACATLPPTRRYRDRGDRAVLMGPICTLAVWSGMRRSEILGLRFRDVEHLPSGWAVAKVRRAVVAAPASEGGYRVKATKNERHREVPLAPEAARVVGARRLALEAELAANDVSGVDIDDAFVLSANFGADPLRPLTVHSWWVDLRAVEPALDRVQFKDARTSHSRKVNRLVGNRGIVAAHMGHGEDVNREHYDGRDPGDLEAVTRAIEGLLDT